MYFLCILDMQLLSSVCSVMNVLGRCAIAVQLLGLHAALEASLDTALQSDDACGGGMHLFSICMAWPSLQSVIEDLSLVQDSATHNITLR